MIRFGSGSLGRVCTEGLFVGRRENTKSLKGKSHTGRKNSGEKLKVLKGKIIKEYIAQRDSL